jgi:hypothetical protein
MHGRPSVPASGSASVDAILSSDSGDSSLIHNLATRAREMEALATTLMRTCYDEANRLANHGSSGLENRVMSQLYDAANDAKKKLNAAGESRAGLD